MNKICRDNQIHYTSLHLLLDHLVTNNYIGACMHDNIEKSKQDYYSSFNFQFFFILVIYMCVSLCLSHYIIPWESGTHHTLSHINTTCTCTCVSLHVCPSCSIVPWESGSGTHPSLSHIPHVRIPYDVSQSVSCST